MLAFLTCIVMAAAAPATAADYLSPLDLVAKTMEVVYAILKSCGMEFSDVVKATAYVKEADDIPAYHKYCTVNKLPAMPIVVAILLRYISQQELLAATHQPVFDLLHAAG
jgi:hypothetical protein